MSTWLKYTTIILGSQEGMNTWLKYTTNVL